MRIARKIAFSILAFSLLGTPAAASFEVSPFVLKLQVGKGQLNGWLEVKPNQDKKPVAVELKVLKRNLDQDGVEVNDSVPSQDLTIFPSELVVYPGEKVKVQVSWAGSSLPTTDRAYTILASEVPIETDRKESSGQLLVGLKTLVRYRLIVALETQKKGSLSVISSRKTEDGKVEVVTENRGAGRIPMEGFFLMVGGRKFDNIQGSGNAVMPGERRRFVLPLETAPAASEIRFGAMDGPIK